MTRDEDTFLRSEEDDYDSSDVDSLYNENELPNEDDLFDFTDNDVQDFEWSYSYSFPSKRRKTRFGKGRYGGKYMTFRKLYDILTSMNDGEGFIDTYFREVFPNTVKPDIEVELAEVKAFLVSMANDILLSNIRTTKRGNLDRRTNARKVLNNYDYFGYKEDYERRRGDYIAGLIKKDIIDSLSSGKIRLNHINKKETFDRRASLGLDSEHVFYASGQLVESIKIFFDIKGSGKWQTVHPNISV